MVIHEWMEICTSEEVAAGGLALLATFVTHLQRGREYEQL